MSAELALFDVAREALAAAVQIDEVKDVRDKAQQAKLYARQAKDKTLLANASALQLRAERRLGELIIAAKDAGEISRGGRPREDGDEGSGFFGETGAETEPVFEPATLKEIGIDKKLSATAQRWAKLGDEEFEQKLEETRDKIISGGAAVVNPLRDLSTGEKKARRAEREAQLGARLVALPEARFGVIYADPEWEHEVWSDGGMHKAAANIYPVSGLDAIKGRDVGSLAADDSVLFMWTTVPHLNQAFEVVATWGFEYVSSAVWVKQYPGNQHGMGYWFRIDHEILLVATRGKVPAPAPGTQFPSVIFAPVREHSRKPDEAYEIIEAYYPTLPKIELNARAARPGWARWGYEAPEGNSPEITDRWISPFAAPSPEVDGDAGKAGQHAFPATNLQKMQTAHPQSAVDADVEEQELIEIESQAAVAGETGEVTAAATFPVTAASLPHPLTFAVARSILEARYATEDGQALADELGVSLGTLRSWAFRAGLTSKARASANGRAHADQLMRGKRLESVEAHDAA